MESMRDGLLSRYREAAETIANAPPKLFSAQDKAGSNDSQHTVDADGRAMYELLSRQATCLLKLHDSLSDTSEGNVDEPLLSQRLDDLASISMGKFYSYRYDLLPYYWREIYTDTLILTTYHHVIRSLRQREWLSEEALDVVVDKLDRAIITAGGAGRLGTRWIEKTLDLLETSSKGVNEGPEYNRAGDDVARPSKRVKVDFGRRFPATEPHGRPAIRQDRQCPRHKGWSLDKFEDYMSDSITPDGKGRPRPVMFTDLIAEWPALTDRPWNSPEYLLSKTFGGRRLVPVEVGRSYVDEGWGQELIPFKAFLQNYVDTTASASDTSAQNNTNKTAAKGIGYLAQHNLFHQVPSLRNDISIPDFCWATVPAHPTDPSKNQAQVDTPHLNAWFGPARTITPLHTDGYHNLLCQVVGSKYVRLYPPWVMCMRPRGEESGVDMSNTSALDLGVIEGWDGPDGDGGGSVDNEDDEETNDGNIGIGDDDGLEESGDLSKDEIRKVKSELEGVEYWECVLEPGDTLVIPIGWWHYVRSLSTSFSVSFWWN